MFGVAFGMSHRSYGSHATETQLEEDETSVQNEDKEVSFDLPEDRIPSDDEEPKRVQGFFGVRPWSIKLSPSNPEPIQDSSPGSGTSILCRSNLRISTLATVETHERLEMQHSTQHQGRKGHFDFSLCLKPVHPTFRRSTPTKRLLSPPPTSA